MKYLCCCKTYLPPSLLSNLSCLCNFMFVALSFSLFIVLALFFDINITVVTSHCNYYVCDCVCLLCIIVCACVCNIYRYISKNRTRTRTIQNCTFSSSQTCWLLTLNKLSQNKMKKISLKENVKKLKPYTKYALVN